MRDELHAPAKTLDHYDDAIRHPEAPPWMAEADRMRLDDDKVGFVGDAPAVRAVEAADQAAPFDIAWCGLFVARCMRDAWPDIDLPLLTMRAQPWLEWGREAEPQLGAPMIFWTWKPWAPFGHVGFYVGEDDTHFHLLGGNQGDAVRVMRMDRGKLLGVRWPGRAEENGLRFRAAPDMAPIRN